MKIGLRHVLVACALLLAPGARAVLMQPLSVSELTQKSDTVVQGIVTGRSSQRDAEGRIYTKVILHIGEVWKGSEPGNTLTLVHGGGTVGNVREEVSGQVEYTVGEEVVAFLVVNPRGEYVTLGLAQGKFHVWRDKQTGEKFAHNIFHGVPEPAGQCGKICLWRRRNTKSKAPQVERP